MPGVDLRTTGLHRERGALLSEGPRQAAAAQAGIYFRRGAVAFYFDAFSFREPVSTSFENAVNFLLNRCEPAGQPHAG